MQLSQADRERHRQWLFELTQLPTASGREHRAIRWVERWVENRPGVVLEADPAGNVHVSLEGGASGGRPVYFTGHLDHPAFVVERMIAPSVLEASFRGGVMDEYFPGARVAVHASDGRTLPGTISGRNDKERVGPFHHWMIDLDDEAGEDDVRVGDVAVWALPPAETMGGCIHTLACDDLAAVAGALAALDVLLVMKQRGEAIEDVRVLLTRAEEIGFVGAIAACRHGTMPMNARVIALENSRSFAESPIGGGPIVRVGDRVSVFSPSLTGAVAKVAERIAGGPSTVTASQKLADLPAWKWQRKLMPGGACEASVFCHFGYESTCVCLPLGNYHNMGDLAAVQAGTATRPPTIEREFVSLADFEGLVDLLVGCGTRMPESDGVGAMVRKLWAERSFVLG